MKNTLFIAMAIIAIAAISGCSNYTQIIAVAPTSENITKSSDNFYEYENSDLKVRYSFWAERGIMGFMIYNKTSHPIYIDWKKSNMINGARQMAYYTNKTVSNFSSYGASYGTSWINILNGVNTQSSGVSAGTQTIVREERISFISPKSYVANAFYNLTANISFDINNSNTEQKYVDGKKMYVSTSNYNISFRNYITYSDNEDFAVEKHVDNGFKVSKVYTMKNEVAKNEDWVKPSRFYITKLAKEDIIHEQTHKL